MSSEDWDNLETENTNYTPPVQKKIDIRPIGQCCNDGVVMSRKDGLVYAFKCGCVLGQRYPDFPQWYENRGYERID